MLQIQSGELLRDCGSSLKKKGYTIKVLNLDEKSHSNHYNPIVYVKKQETIYDVLKTGKVAIKRDKNQQTITLITCQGSDRQLVVIGYLKKI